MGLGKATRWRTGRKERVGIGKGSRMEGAPNKQASEPDEAPLSFCCCLLQGKRRESTSSCNASVCLSRRRRQAHRVQWDGQHEWQTNAKGSRQCGPSRLAQKHTEARGVIPT